MEPLNAVARFNEAGDRLEVWDGIAGPWRLPPADCAHARSQAGAGRGPSVLSRRRLRAAFLGDYAAEAALIARAAKRPVKLVWTREEDIAYGMFRPIAFQRLEAALDASGKVIGWRHGVVGDDGDARWSPAA